MLERIPHPSEEISGGLKTENYVKSHEKYAKTHFSAFISELAGQLKVFGSITEGRFLEIGSGPGFLTSIIADLYPRAEINALELSPDMISVAKDIVTRTQPSSRVRFIKGSVEDESLMARLGKFDLVYSTFSMHHWERPVQAMKSMHKALRNRGLLMVHDLKRVSLLYLLPLQNGLINSIRAAYRPVEIRNIMLGAGIRDFEIKTHFPYFWYTILATN